jgi:SOS-response transcriptional repressor LexA
LSEIKLNIWTILTFLQAKTYHELMSRKKIERAKNDAPEFCKRWDKLMSLLQETGLTQEDIEDAYGIGLRTQRDWAESVPSQIQKTFQLLDQRVISRMWLFCECGPKDPEIAYYVAKLGEAMERDARLRGQIEGVMLSAGHDIRRFSSVPYSSTSFIAKTPRKNDDENPRIIDLPVAAFEPIEDRPRKTNDTQWLRDFDAFDFPATNTTPLPGWLGAAAGDGREIERAEEPLYVSGKLPPDHKYLTIRGDSMEDTILDKSIVVVRDLGEQGVELPPLQAGKEKTPIHVVKSKVPNNSICLLSIDGGELTVKRVRYRGTPQNWHMVIVADNPHHQPDVFPYPVPREQSITFWAVVVGRVTLKG